MADNIYILSIYRTKQRFPDARYRWVITEGEPEYYTMSSDGTPRFRNEKYSGDAIWKRNARKAMNKKLKELLTDPKDKIKLVYQREVVG